MEKNCVLLDAKEYGELLNFKYKYEYLSRYILNKSQLSYDEKQLYFSGDIETLKYLENELYIKKLEELKGETNDEQL